MAVSMDELVSLLKRRGFVMPGSDIYGGLANSWDYGPLGAELKKNIKDEWWNRFVRRRTDMVGIDAALIMNPKVWEASGHVQEFADPLVECKQCHERFRADQIAGACSSCGGEFAPAKQFNLLFKTFIGPTEDAATAAYLRGELAQAMFVDFPWVLQATRRALPFGIAAQGKVFRNEITPGNFIFRTREFDLMEFEYFVREAEWEQWFAYWQAEMEAWLAHCGVAKGHYHIHDIPDGERAHYSKRTIDIEYDYPFGRKELYGLAYRTDFDLKRHAEASGKDMKYTDEGGVKFLPHVIEPTFGLDRTVLVALLEAYCEEPAPTAAEGETDARTVLKLPYWMSPYKAALLPLSKKEALTNIAAPLYESLRKEFMCDYDETQSIGKRYRRQDEIGTPFCITVDFETPNDNMVTIRERDSMKQERVPIDHITAWVRERLS
jgi:glycyl-tRNA synthetase